MAHTSPAVNLVWSLLSIGLGCFLLFHLWSFDRFKCLRWNHGPHSGTFKRVMTYSYIMSVPLLLIYSMGFASIKYRYGFTFVPGYGILPTPYELWSESDRRAIFPLYLVVSLAWGLEMVSHLEELCFWLFVVNSGAMNQDWFRTIYFKIWAVGSCIAVLYMPLITILSRNDVYKCEALTFLAGGLGSFFLTVWFLPVLWAFPRFIASLKPDLDMVALVRLTKFHELNCVRIVFRFFFTVPLITLGIDGIRPHQHINDKMFPTDLLAMIAGMGCVLSSMITLVIFFPRSIEGEIAAKEKIRSRRRLHSHGSGSFWRRSWRGSRGSDAESHASINKSVGNLYDQHPTRHNFFGLPGYEAAATADDGAGLGVNTFVSSSMSPKTRTTDMGMETIYPSMVMQPNRRTRDGDVEFGMIVTMQDMAEERERMRRGGSMYKLMYNWRSPIDFERGQY